MVKSRRLVVLAVAVALLPLSAFADEGRRGLDAWVFVRGDDSTSMSGTMKDLELARSKQKGDKPLLYARVGRKGWVFRDGATLAKLRELFAPLDALEDEMQAITRQHEPLADRMGELGEKMGELGEKVGELGSELGEAWGDDARRDELEAAMRLLEDEMRELERPMRELEQKMRPLQAEMERIADRMQEASAELEERIADIVLDALARRRR
jgi:prefoldin subunit 5